MHRIDFERLFEILPSPHMVVDLGFSFVGCNRAYEKAVARPRAEMIGHNIFDLFPNAGESGRRLRASFERVRDTGESDTLAFLPYDIPRQTADGLVFDQRFWTCAQTAIFDKEGKVAFILQNTVDVTDMARLRRASLLPFHAFSGETQLLERTREVEEAHQALLAESEEFRRLFQQAPGFIAVLSGRDHVFTFANDAYTQLIGGRDVLGQPVRQALPEIEGQGFYEMLDQVYSTAQPLGGQGVRVLLQQTAGEELRELFIDFTYSAIRSKDGEVTGVFVQGMDRTETVRTLRRQRVLIDEVNHRVKNTLATVQSIASQTLRNARDLPSARVDFESRILALSKAHNMLSDRQWESTELSALVCQELSAFGRQRIEADGPAVALNAKASIAMAMLLHELAVNASKYGALSRPEGTVSISWHRQDQGDERFVVLDWIEKGGPGAEPPARHGFGMRMIERVAAGELGGSFEPHFGEEGFSCRLRFAAASLSPTTENEFA